MVNLSCLGHVHTAHKVALTRQLHELCWQRQSRAGVYWSR